MQDIPPRIRLLLTIAAIGGLIFIAMGSLADGSGHQIALDKLVHGIGYGLLGMLIVMGMPPTWYLPALFAVVLAGLGLEYAQALVIRTRSFEMKDVLANAVGLALGGLVGFVARVAWSFVRRELIALGERRRLEIFQDGDTIFREGDPSDFLYVVRKGEVSLVTNNGMTLGTAGVGEVIGEMGVIERVPRSASAIAVGEAVLYRLDAEALEETVEGREHPAVPVARVLAKRLREANAERFGTEPAGDRKSQSAGDRT